MTIRTKPGPTARARKAKAAKRLRDYRKAARQVVTDLIGEFVQGGEVYVPCAGCGRLSNVAQIHHKRPRSLAPELRTEASNLEPLCPDCHTRAHARGRRD